MRSWQRFDKEDVGRLGGSGSRRQRSALKNEARANGFEEDALADRAEGEVAQESAAGTIARGVAGKAAPAASPARKAGLGGGGGAAAGGSDPVGTGGGQRLADNAALVTPLTTGADRQGSTAFDKPGKLTTWKINRIEEPRVGE